MFCNCHGSKVSGKNCRFIFWGEWLIHLFFRFPDSCQYKNLGLIVFFYFLPVVADNFFARTETNTSMLNSQNVQRPKTWNRLEEREEASPVPSVRRSQTWGGAEGRACNKEGGQGDQHCPLAQFEFERQGCEGSIQGGWICSCRLSSAVTHTCCCTACWRNEPGLWQGVWCPAGSVGSCNKWHYIPAAVSCPFSRKWQRSVGLLWKGQPSCCWPLQVSLWCHDGISEGFFSTTTDTLKTREKNDTQ